MGAPGAGDPAGTPAAGPAARRPAAGRGPGRPRDVALAALERVDEGGAYANLVLPPMLRRSRLTLSERAAVTDLVYGSLRMRGPSTSPWRRCRASPWTGWSRWSCAACAWAPTSCCSGARPPTPPSPRPSARSPGPATAARPATSTPCSAAWPRPRPPGPTRDRPGRLGHHPRLPPAWIVEEALARLGPRSWSPWSRPTTPAPRSACGPRPAAPPATSCWPSWPRPA